MRAEIAIKTCLNALTAFIIAGSGVMIASITQQGEVTTVALWLGVLTGLASAANDVRAYLTQPPRDPTRRTRRGDRRLVLPPEGPGT